MTPRISPTPYAKNSTVTQKRRAHFSMKLRTRSPAGCLPPRHISKDKRRHNRRVRFNNVLGRICARVRYANGQDHLPAGSRYRVASMGASMNTTGWNKRFDCEQFWRYSVWIFLPERRILSKLVAQCHWNLVGLAKLPRGYYRRRRGESQECGERSPYLICPTTKTLS